MADAAGEAPADAGAVLAIVVAAEVDVEDAQFVACGGGVRVRGGDAGVPHVGALQASEVAVLEHPPLECGLQVVGRVVSGGEVQGRAVPGGGVLYVEFVDHLVQVEGELSVRGGAAHCGCSCSGWMFTVVSGCSGYSAVSVR